MQRRSTVALAAAVLLSPLAAYSQRFDFRAGAARVDITPDAPVALSGYSNPENRISEGVHDRLYARAVAFKSGGKKLVLVSCDLTGFQTAPAFFFQKEIYSKFDLQPDELFLCGTHTHSGPMLFLNKTYPHPNNSQYTEALRAKLVEAVGKALASAVPARLVAAVGHSPIAVNRRLPVPAGQAGESRVTMGRNPEGPVDREVQVFKIATPDGIPIAALFDYACHSRSLRSANKLVSGDVLGIAEQFVEKILGRNIVSPAFAGASGDIDPWYVLPGFHEEPGWIPETVLMGTMLGEEVVHVFRNADPLSPGGEIRTKSQRIALPGKAPGASSPGVEAPTRYIQITAAAVGDIAFLGLDCEALVEVGKAIKAKSPFSHTFIVTNCNGGSGYLPPAHAYAERGYEVDLSGFAPQAAGMVVETATNVLSSLRR